VQIEDLEKRSCGGRRDESRTTTVGKGPQHRARRVAARGGANALLCAATAMSLADAQAARAQAAMITYALGRGLYVALTNRCNATPLFHTRGPGFSITSTRFEPLPAGFEPEPHRIVAEVAGALAARPGQFDSVVFAGLGEPTLRLRDMLAISEVKACLWVRAPAGAQGALCQGALRACRAQGPWSEPCLPARARARVSQTLKSGAAKDLPLRVSTNGIGSVVNGRDIAPELAAAGISGVTVALNTGRKAHTADCRGSASSRASSVFLRASASLRHRIVRRVCAGSEGSLYIRVQMFVRVRMHAGQGTIPLSAFRLDISNLACACSLSCAVRRADATGDAGRLAGGRV